MALLQLTSWGLVIINIIGKYISGALFFGFCAVVITYRVIDPHRKIIFTGTGAHKEQIEYDFKKLCAGPGIFIYNDGFVVETTDGATAYTVLTLQGRILIVRGSTSVFHRALPGHAARPLMGIALRFRIQLYIFFRRNETQKCIWDKVDTQGQAQKKEAVMKQPLFLTSLK